MNSPGQPAQSLSPGIRVADGVEVPPESVMLMWAERAVRRRIREILSTKSRSGRETLRHELEAMARESLQLLGQEVEVHGVENVSWEVLL